MVQIFALVATIGIIITMFIFRKVIFKSFYELDKFAESLADDIENKPVTQEKERKDE